MKEHIFGRLRQAAAELTNDPGVQKKLMQEMYVHLLDVRTDFPGRPTDWYIRQCTGRARDYLGCGHPELPETDERSAVRSGESPRVTVLSPSLPVQLPPRQQEAFERFRQGCGIRETARQLGISHVAVIKLRNKIVRRLPDTIPPSALPPVFEGMRGREAVTQMS